MYCEYIRFLYQSCKISYSEATCKKKKNQGNIRAYTLWILSDCASAEVIYIVLVSCLTALLFKVLRVVICVHVKSYEGV